MVVKFRPFSTCLKTCVAKPSQCSKEPWHILVASTCYFRNRIISFFVCLLYYRRNFNYGAAGEALKVDLLNHPEYIEQNATLAFQAAIWRWMTEIKKGQPSSHDVFVGNWKPTKNDALAKRVPGFGATMNILYGEMVCGQGDIDAMNNIVSHYQHYLDLIGVGREEAGPHDVLTCADQLAFNPATATAASWVLKVPANHLLWDCTQVLLCETQLVCQNHINCWMIYCPRSLSDFINFLFHFCSYNLYIIM